MGIARSATAKVAGASVALCILAGIWIAAARPSSSAEALSLHEFAIPAIQLPPGPIVADSRGNVWFAELAGLRIGELRADGTFHFYQLHNDPAQILALVASRDGTLWFAQSFTYDGSHNWIGKIASDGRVAMYRLPRNDAFVNSILAAEANGVWVSEMGAHRVARITNSGEIREYVLPGPKDEFVRSLVLGTDGSVWVAQDDAVVHLYPSGSAQRFPVPLPRTKDGIRNMVPSTAGSFWMTLYAQRGEPDAIWRFTPPHTMTSYTYPGPRFGAIVLVAGPDGGAWFPELGGASIDHIDRSGKIARYPIPLRGSDFQGMTLSDNGGLWFTNMQSGKLGYLGQSQPNPLPKVSPLSAFDQSIVATWRKQLQPRQNYNMSTVTADTLRVASGFAIVGWSDLDGNAATLLGDHGGAWHTISVANGNFYRVDQLTALGVPQDVAAQLLKGANVKVVPAP
jgi:virginiamycin B lyase